MKCKIFDCFETILNGYLREKSLAGHGEKFMFFLCLFSEFYSFINGNLDYAFDEYMIYGGLPANI